MPQVGRCARADAAASRPPHWQPSRAFNADRCDDIVFRMVHRQTKQMRQRTLQWQPQPPRVGVPQPQTEGVEPLVESRTMPQVSVLEKTQQPRGRHTGSPPGHATQIATAMDCLLTICPRASVERTLTMCPQPACMLLRLVILTATAATSCRLSRLAARILCGAEKKWCSQHLERRASCSLAMAHECRAPRLGVSYQFLIVSIHAFSSAEAGHVILLL
jgi:hypothetical protein